MSDELGGVSARLNVSAPTPCPPADRSGDTNILWMSVLRGGEGRRMGLCSRHRAGLGRGLDGGAVEEASAREGRRAAVPEGEDTAQAGSP